MSGAMSGAMSEHRASLTVFDVGDLDYTAAGL
jgi:hypothetical protein